MIHRRHQGRFEKCALLGRRQVAPQHQPDHLGEADRADELFDRIPAKPDDARLHVDDRRRPPLGCSLDQIRWAGLSHVKTSSVMRSVGSVEGGSSRVAGTGQPYVLELSARTLSSGSLGDSGTVGDRPTRQPRSRAMPRSRLSCSQARRASAPCPGREWAAEPASGTPHRAGIRAGHAERLARVIVQRQRLDELASDDLFLLENLRHAENTAGWNAFAVEQRFPFLGRSRLKSGFEFRR